MGFLISSEWVIREAQQLGIQVPDAQVKRTFEQIRHEQFPRRGECKKFLRSSGETVADLLLRVRLNLLSAAIQQRVVAGQTTQEGKEQAMASFLSSFAARWRAQTECLAGYAVHDCGVVIHASL